MDTCKPGSMTLVTFYLVDPEMPDSEVLSAAVVPPQRKTWLREALEMCIDVKIPVELIDKIMSFVDGLMDDDEAAHYADAMRTEREDFWQVHDRQWFSLPFNIWQN